MVRELTEKDGGEVLNWNSDPDLAIFILSRCRRNVHFVVVCPGRYLEEPAIPDNLGGSVQYRASLNPVLAATTVVSADDPIDPDATNVNFYRCGEVIHIR